MQPSNLQNTIAGQILRQPNDYWAFIPKPLPPTIHWSSDLVAKLSSADRAIGELAGLGRTLPNPDLLIKPFMRREAVLSSRIEGTRASVADLYAWEVGQPTLFELPDDVREVENYLIALNYGLSRLQNFPLSLRFIRELHARLLKGVRGEQWTPGEFRRSQNWIGTPGSSLTTARYVPPPPKVMHSALHDLEQFLHTDSTLPPVIRIALIHYQFEAIHPFLDGNGRVGRLLINLLFFTWNLLPHPLLYISAWFNEHRQSYYDSLLAVSLRGAWEEWLLFFLEGVQAQAFDSIQRIRQLQQLQEGYRTQFQSARSSARLLRSVDILFEQPVLTVQQLAEKLSVNYPTAARYMSQLVDAGVVVEITGRARGRVFAARSVINAVSDV